MWATKSCEFLLLVAGLAGLRPVHALSAQEDVRPQSVEATRMYASVSATIGVLLEDLVELRRINETRGSRRSAGEWNKQISVIDSGVTILASQVLALNSADRLPIASQVGRVAIELQGSARKMRVAHGALVRASDTHSTRTAIMHLAAILEVMRQTIGAPPDAARKEDGNVAQGRI